MGWAKTFGDSLHCPRCNMAVSPHPGLEGELRIYTCAACGTTFRDPAQLQPAPIFTGSGQQFTSVPSGRSNIFGAQLIQMPTANLVHEVSALLDRASEQRDNKSESRSPPSQEEIAAFKELQKAFIEHLRWRFSYPATVLKHHQLATGCSGVVALVLLCSGIAFSVVQLLIAWQIGSVKDATNVDLVIKAGEVSFKSSALGAGMLLAALWFFKSVVGTISSLASSPPIQVGIEADQLAIARAITRTDSPLEDPSVASEKDASKATPAAKKGKE